MENSARQVRQHFQAEPLAGRAAYSKFRGVRHGLPSAVSECRRLKCGAGESSLAKPPTSSSMERSGPFASWPRAGAGVSLPWPRFPWQRLRRSSERRPLPGELCCLLARRLSTSGSRWATGGVTTFLALSARPTPSPGCSPSSVRLSGGSRPSFSCCCGLRQCRSPGWGRGCWPRGSPNAREFGLSPPSPMACLRPCSSLFSTGVPQRFSRTFSCPGFSLRGSERSDRGRLPVAPALHGFFLF